MRAAVRACGLHRCAEIGAVRITRKRLQVGFGVPLRVIQHMAPIQACMKGERYEARAEAYPSLRLSYDVKQHRILTPTGFQK